LGTGFGKRLDERAARRAEIDEIADARDADVVLIAGENEVAAGARHRLAERLVVRVAGSGR
jgi:hypothetical protein